MLPDIREYTGAFSRDSEARYYIKIAAIAVIRNEWRAKLSQFPAPRNHDRLCA